MNLPTKITFSRIILVVVLFVALFALSLVPNIETLNAPLYTLSAPLADGNSATFSITPIYLATFIVFVVASGTDWLDGYLARRNNQVTTLGKFLDPIADKMLVNSTLIFLAVGSALPYSGDQLVLNVFVVILFIVRDLIVDAVRLIAASTGARVISANIFGKLKTIFQMVAIPVYLLNGYPFTFFDYNWPEPLRIANLLMYLALFFSLLSGIIYVVKNKDVLVGKKSD